MQRALIEPETERLTLRQWRDSDYAPYVALNADPRVMEHFPNTLDKAASDAMADKIRSLITEQGWGFWAVERKDTQAFIGSVGLHRPTADLPFNPCVEIGWRLAAEHWGQGYATEAARAALQVGFETLGLEEIVAFTALSNLKSQAVMERLGMQRDEETFEHPDVPIGNPLREHCLYRMTSDSYFQKD
jgi:RimJ/RimL family protein N-acetyltransferase